MNRRGEIADVLWDNAIYIILAVLFFSLMITYLYKQENGAVVWEEFYAKEIAKVVNLASVGDEIKIDVHKGTEVAKRNDADVRRIVEFDNAKREVCVGLSLRGKTCYNYYNDVDAVESEIVFASGESGGRNLLKFKVVERRAG